MALKITAKGRTMTFSLTDLEDYRNLGSFPNLEALQAEHPTGEAGDFAILESTDTVWVWDSDNNEWSNSNKAMPQEQADFNQTDPLQMDFIKNKPKGRFIGFFNSLADLESATPPTGGLKTGDWCALFINGNWVLKVYNAEKTTSKFRKFVQGNGNEFFTFYRGKYSQISDLPLVEKYPYPALDVLREEWDDVDATASLSTPTNFALYDSDNREWNEFTELNQLLPTQKRWLGAGYDFTDNGNVKNPFTNVPPNGFLVGDVIFQPCFVFENGHVYHQVEYPGVALSSIAPDGDYNIEDEDPIYKKYEVYRIFIYTTGITEGWEDVSRGLEIIFADPHNVTDGTFEPDPTINDGDLVFTILEEDMLAVYQ